MGIRSVEGPGSQNLANDAARVPAPRPRASEKADSAPPSGRAGPVTENEQAPRQEKVEPQELANMRSGTRMRVDESTNRVIVQIIGPDNEVIKQIPPEELLKIAARLRDLRGKMFDEKV